MMSSQILLVSTTNCHTCTVAFQPTSTLTGSKISPSPGIHGHGSLSPAPDFSSLSKELPLRHLASGSQHPNLADLSLSSFREMDKDLPSGGPSRCGPWQDAIIPIYAASLIIAIAVTTAMVLQIYLGTNEVCSHLEKYIETIQNNFDLLPYFLSSSLL